MVGRKGGRKVMLLCGLLAGKSVSEQATDGSFASRGTLGEENHLSINGIVLKEIDL
jgi:hypothetical protein